MSSNQNDNNERLVSTNLVQRPLSQCIDHYDDMSFYKSITVEATSHEKLFQVRKQTKFQSYYYFRWCFFKYFSFATVSIVYVFVVDAKLWICNIGFLPLYSIAIFFVIVTMITMCIMHLTSGLSLWILNMFTTFDFLYFSFKILQCEDTTSKTCKLFRDDDDNVLSIIDIVIGIMIILWIWSVLLYCFRHSCDCANYLRQHCMFYLLIIIWIMVIGVTMTCSVWQSIQDDTILRLIIRIIIAILAIDTFVLQKTRHDVKRLIIRHLSYKTENHLSVISFVDDTSSDTN